MVIKKKSTHTILKFFPPPPGGVVTAGLAIYDTMQYILNPISTWCVGQAASMGSLLLAAGTSGMRHSLPNARIMVHQPSGGARVRWGRSDPLNSGLKSNMRVAIKSACPACKGDGFTECASVPRVRPQTSPSRLRRS